MRMMDDDPDESMTTGRSPSGAGGQESVCALTVSRQIFAINTTAGWALVPAMFYSLSAFTKIWGNQSSSEMLSGNVNFADHATFIENNRNSKTIRRASTTFLFPLGFSVEQYSCDQLFPPLTLAHQTPDSSSSSTHLSIIRP